MEPISTHVYFPEAFGLRSFLTVVACLLTGSLMLSGCHDDETELLNEVVFRTQTAVNRCNFSGLAPIFCVSQDISAFLDGEPYYYDIRDRLEIWMRGSDFIILVEGSERGYIGQNPLVAADLPLQFPFPGNNTTLLDSNIIVFPENLSGFTTMSSSMFGSGFLSEKNLRRILETESLWWYEVELNFSERDEKLLEGFRAFGVEIFDGSVDSNGTSDLNGTAPSIRSLNSFLTRP